MFPIEGKVITEIKCKKTENGVFQEEFTSLNLTPEQYSEIISKYGNGNKTVYKYKENILSVGKDETVTCEGFVKNEGFVKAVVLFKSWLDAIEKAIFKKENFRAEIVHDTEGLNTYFCIYTKSNEQKCD